jgi:predicted lipid-binding transport protein (Tim44 family)
LMSHLGLSEAFGSVLLIALLVIAAVVLVRLIFARRMTPAYRAEGNSGYPTARAEPTMRVEPALGGRADTTSVTTGPSFPAGFNPEPFLQQAKVQFRRLQTAYDNADRRTLADVMTPEMFAEVARDLDQRGAHVPTDVVALDAEIREVVQEGDRYVASVKFTGALREDGASEAKPFVEVWNLVKPVDGSSGWMLAGIQQHEDSLVAQ